MNARPKHGQLGISTKGPIPVMHAHIDMDDAHMAMANMRATMSRANTAKPLSSSTCANDPSHMLSSSNSNTHLLMLNVVA